MSRLEWLAAVAVLHSVLSGSLTGPPPWRFLPALRDSWTPVCAVQVSLEARWPAWLAAQGPEYGMVSRMCVVVPRSCGYGPREAKWVGAMGKQPSHQQPISGWHCVRQAQSPKQGWWLRSGRSRRPGPARGGGQASPSHSRFALVDNRSEGLSLPLLARQLVPWTAKWQCCECRH